MSLRLLAVLPHQFRTFEDVASVPAILTQLAPLDRAVSEAYWQKPFKASELIPEGWRIGPVRRPPEVEWNTAGRLAYHTAADSFVYFGRRCMVLLTIAKWYYARGQPGLLAAAHRLFQGLAREIAAPHYLVYHDNGSSVYFDVQTGMTFDETRASILAGGARPAASMDGLFLTEQQIRYAAKAPDLFYEEAVAPRDSMEGQRSQGS